MFWRKKPPSGKPHTTADHAIKDRATRAQRKWLDRAAAEARTVRVAVPLRVIEYHLAELDALDQQDFY